VIKANVSAVSSEPTSVIKSTAILPAISATLDAMNKSRAPIAYASPNLLELAQLEQASRAEPLELTSHPSWWSVIDSFTLGSDFRRDLERLANKRASDNDISKGTLAFLVDQGVAQTMVKLLPFFQHLVVKCGPQGGLVAMRINARDALTSPWAHRRSDSSQRCVIARGNSGDLLVLQHFPAHHIETVVNVTGAGDSFVGALLASLVQNRKAFQDPKTLNDAISAAQRAAILSLQSEFAVSPLLS
jgi:pseudouridine-5'-phosphate glycosidase/pseudouridine kinase